MLTAALPVENTESSDRFVVRQSDHVQFVFSFFKGMYIINIYMSAFLIKKSVLIDILRRQLVALFSSIRRCRERSHVNYCDNRSFSWIDLIPLKLYVLSGRFINYMFDYIIYGRRRIRCCSYYLDGFSLVYDKCYRVIVYASRDAFYGHFLWMNKKTWWHPRKL